MTVVCSVGSGVGAGVRPGCVAGVGYRVCDIGEVVVVYPCDGLGVCGVGCGVAGVGCGALGNGVGDNVARGVGPGVVLSFVVAFGVGCGKVNGVGCGVGVGCGSVYGVGC